MVAKSLDRFTLAARSASAVLFAIALGFGVAAAQTVAPPAAGPDLPSTAEAWSAAAKRDVEAAYRLFVDNHPGMVNADDPGFPAQLKAARDRGLDLAVRVRDGAGYAAALQGFSAGLRDGHALVVADLPAGSTLVRWPGFVAVWRGDGLRVFGSSVPEAPAGAAILGCDGRDGRALMLQNVFAYGGRPDEAGQWWQHGSNLFRDDGNPLVNLPQRCRISVGGKVSEIVLTWRPVDEQYRVWRAARSGEAPAPGLTEPRPGLFWLALPTFTPNDAQIAAYRHAFDELARRRSEVLAADALVIDLRGNQGGSSAWSADAARVLWGATPRPADPSRVVWRASLGNIRHVVQLAPKVRADGQVQAAADLDRIAAGMTAALAKGDPTWQEPVDPPPAPTADLPPGAALAPLRTPVYVIVPGQCASACLDALDVFTPFPNTRLIGAPSSADTVYMDVRLEPLPGGLAKVVIPNKFYRRRPRASGQVYTPAIEVDDLLWSTAAFRQVVEADLRTRPAVSRKP